MTRTERPDVQGFLSDREFRTLRELSAGVSVVEIGCWKGRSTCAIAETAAAVMCVDHWIGDDFAGRPAQAAILEQFLNNVGRDRTAFAFANQSLCKQRTRQIVDSLKTNSLNDSQVRVVLDDFRNVPSSCLFHKPGFGFYDADHTGEATAAGLALLDSIGTTTIAVHDYVPGNPNLVDAVAAVDEFVARSGRAIVLVDRLAILEPRTLCVRVRDENPH